jgi:vacuolar-type H+-ATPase subunit I/STV1
MTILEKILGTEKTKEELEKEVIALKNELEFRSDSRWGSKARIESLLETVILENRSMSSELNAALNKIADLEQSKKEKELKERWDKLVAAVGDELVINSDKLEEISDFIQKKRNNEPENENEIQELKNELEIKSRIISELRNIVDVKGLGSIVGDFMVNGHAGPLNDLISQFEKIAEILKKDVDNS